MAETEVTLKVNGADVTLNKDDHGVWQHKELGLPPDNVVSKYLSEADEFIGKVEKYLAVADKVAGIAEKVAPLYADAETTILKTAVKVAREGLYSLSLNFHVLVADAPYGVTHGAPTKDLATFQGLLQGLAPQNYDGLVALPTPKGGAPALRQIVLDSLTDLGDYEKPHLKSTTAVAGITLVAGASSGADLQELVKQFRKLQALISAMLGLDYWRSQWVGAAGSPEFAPAKLRVRDVVVEQGRIAPTLYWVDNPLRFPYEADGIEGTTYTVLTPPLYVELWACANPAKFRQVPGALDLPAPELTVAGVTTATDPDWVFVDRLKVPRTSDGKQTDWGPSAFWDLSELKIPYSSGAVPQCALFLRYVFPEENLQVMGSDGIPLPALEEVLVGPSLPVVHTKRAKASSASAASVKPNWHAGGTYYTNVDDQKSELAARSFLDQAIGTIDQKVLTPYEDTLVDQSENTVRVVKNVRKYIAEIRKTVAEIHRLVALLAQLTKARVGAYGRAFAYGLNPLGGADLSGLAALESEYTTSLRQIPFQGENDVVMGVFIVMTAPANAATQLQPLLAAISALLGLVGSTSGELLGLWQQLTGDSEPAAAPALPGQTTRPDTTVTQPLIGADDTPGVDRNCPPARDLSKLSFTDSLTPVGV